MEEVILKGGLVVMAWIGEGQAAILVRKNISQGPEGGAGMICGGTAETTVENCFTW